MMIARLKIDGKTVVEAIKGTQKEISVDITDPMKLLFVPRLVKAGLIIARNNKMSQKIVVNPGIISKLFLHAPGSQKNLENKEED